MKIKRLRQLFGRQAPHSTKDPQSFEADPLLGISRRRYNTYQGYLEHQADKLSRDTEQIVASDSSYESVVATRYRSMHPFEGRSVLCLGARLGGEVRAFKSLGALAIGIDIQPGPLNRDVLYGDFHNVQFPDGTFDAAFTNAVDHVFDLPRFLSEVHRVLKPGALFLMELACVKPGRYEVLDTSDPGPIIELCGELFCVESRTSITNRTEYVDWAGILLSLRKPVVRPLLNEE